MEFIYKAFYPNPMGTYIYNNIRGSWCEGVYMKHLKTLPSPIGDCKPQAEYEHLLFMEGVADWNMPVPIVSRPILPETLSLKLDVKVKNETLYVNDIVKFRYHKCGFEYIGDGIVKNKKEYVYLEIENNEIPLSDVSLIQIVGNIFDGKTKPSLLLLGFHGTVINAYWSGDDSVTHTLVIQDGNHKSWYFGGLDLHGERSSIWIKHLMRVFATKNISDNSFIGRSVFVAVENGTAVAIAVNGEYQRIMDTRNIFDNFE